MLELDSHSAGSVPKWSAGKELTHSNALSSLGMQRGVMTAALTRTIKTLLSAIHAMLSPEGQADNPKQKRASEGPRH